MKIVKDSIIDLQDKFIELKSKFYHDEQNRYFVGCNLALNVKYFEYEEDTFFKENNMYEIFAPEKEVEGVPCEVSWDACLGELRDFLKHPSFKGEVQRYLDRVDLPDPKLGEERVLLLVNELRKYISLPPEKVYRYEIGENAWFFKDIVPWYFCYAFLSKGKGMIVNAFADL